MGGRHGPRSCFYNFGVLSFKFGVLVIRALLLRIYNKAPESWKPSCSSCVLGLEPCVGRPSESVILARLILPIAIATAANK